MFRTPWRRWHAAVSSFCGLLALCCSSAAQERESSERNSKVGVVNRSFAPKESYNWRGAQTHALGAVIWYPANAAAIEQPMTMGGPPDRQLFIIGDAAPSAAFPPAPARFPLIVLSHGTGGTALSMGWLGTALAAHGYIVAAVNHPGNNGTEAYTVEGFSTWWERARDLSEVIGFLLKDETLGSRIDEKRIGAAGFSLGGYTMIEIAGGITEPAGLLELCASPRADGLCQSPPEFPTLFEDFKKLAQDRPEFLRHSSDSYRDNRVRAVFAMAPALGPVFKTASLAKIAIPVEIVAGESDSNVPIASSAKYFAANIPGASLYIFPGAAGHYVFLDSCPEFGRQSRPMLCTDASGVDRDKIHAATVRRAVDFFAANLK